MSRDTTTRRLIRVAGPTNGLLGDRDGRLSTSASVCATRKVRRHSDSDIRRQTVVSPRMARHVVSGQLMTCHQPCTCRHLLIAGLPSPSIFPPHHDERIRTEPQLRLSLLRSTLPYLHTPRLSAATTFHLHRSATPLHQPSTQHATRPLAARKGRVPAANPPTPISPKGYSVCTSEFRRPRRWPHPKTPSQACSHGQVQARLRKATAQTCIEEECNQAD